VKRTTTFYVALLVCALTLASWNVLAQGHAAATRKAREDSPKARAAKMAELDAWLRRLAGQFRVSVTPGTATIISPCGSNPADRPAFGTCTTPDRVNTNFFLSPTQGTADCRSIEPGPGVSCVLDFDDTGSELPTAAPRVILLGMDPDEPGIRLMEVGRVNSAAWTAHGSLTGDTVTFIGVCVSGLEPPTLRSSCKRKVGIRALIDGKRIVIDMSASATLPPGVVEAAPPGITLIDFMRVADSGR